MDLGTIKTNIEEGKYAHEDEFIADMRLVFSNCRLYNKPTDDIIKMANAVESAFEKELKKMPKVKSVSSRSRTQAAADPADYGYGYAQYAYTEPPEANPAYPEAGLAVGPGGRGTPVARPSSRRSTNRTSRKNNAVALEGIDARLDVKLQRFQVCYQVCQKKKKKFVPVGGRGGLLVCILGVVSVVG